MPPEKNQNVRDNVFYNISFFHNDQEILFLYQKVERICGAIFLVTRLVEDTNLIKKTIQEGAILSFRECHLLVVGSEITTQKLKNLSLSLGLLYAYLDSAFWSGLLSHMNASVIQKEIHFCISLISQLDEKYKNITNPKSSFFTLIEKNDTSSASPRIVKDSTSLVKDTIRDNIKDRIKDNNEERLGKIRALMRDFKARNLKDIASLFPEVSPKTIQREINRLIGQGIIKRIGDKRWSTYVLIS